MESLLAPGDLDPRLQSLQQILQYVIPVLSAVILPFSLVNIYLLFLQEAEKRPSHLLYLNLLVAGRNGSLGKLLMGNIASPTKSVSLFSSP